MGSIRTRAMLPSPTTGPTILGPIVAIPGDSILYHDAPILVRARGLALPNFVHRGGPDRQIGRPFAPAPQSVPLRQSGRLHPRSGPLRHQSAPLRHHDHLRPRP